MRNYILIIIFILLFILTCNNGKAETNIEDILNGKEIKLDDYSMKIVNLIIKKDLKELASYFDDKIMFGDYEYGIDVFKNKAYDGFLNGEGILYYLFFDTKSLNKIDRPYMLRKEAPCILNAIKSSSKILLFAEIDGSPYIYIELKDNKNYSGIVLLMNPENKKIYNIFYGLN